ncbi:hypothetical protein C8R46DRAFT_1229986 [Mycena filopes]|nr:hypothetical protein C8R46DRAFT_1229986 [Mycena filopes]
MAHDGLRRTPIIPCKAYAMLFRPPLSNPATRKFCLAVRHFLLLGLYLGQFAQSQRNKPRSFFNVQRLVFPPGFVHPATLSNLYRRYIIYGETVGGVECRWSRRTFTCAAGVWAALHLEIYNLIRRSWYIGDPDGLAAQHHRITALRTLACALEAQGDKSRFVVYDASN